MTEAEKVMAATETNENLEQVQVGEAQLRILWKVLRNRTGATGKHRESKETNPRLIH